MAERKCWLVKSEPECFSIEHLARSPRQTACWSGVRNYQARNFMRDMRLGDRVLYFHSNASPPAVAGTAKVVREVYADHTALDPKDDHYDAKASAENPIWEMVDIQLDEVFAELIPLESLRKVPGLDRMELLRKGSRLSVQPVRPQEFETILALAHTAAKKPGSTKNAASPAKKTTVPKSRKAKAEPAARNSASRAKQRIAK
jgi:predicted RNA-binding protein with PUA-like domain